MTNVTVTWHCLFSSSSHSSHSCRLARYWKVGPGEDLLVRQHNATLDIFICYLFLLSKTHPALKKFKEHSIVFQKWFRFTLLLVSSKYVFINCHSFSGLSLRWTDYPRTATTACSPAPVLQKCDDTILLFGSPWSFCLVAFELEMVVWGNLTHLSSEGSPWPLLRHRLDLKYARIWTALFNWCKLLAKPLSR